MQPQQMQPGMMQMQPMQSDKNWVAVLLLGLLGIFGIAGIDRFYTGSILLGVLKLITFGGLGIWTIIDVILVVTGSYKDGNGHAVVVN
ncbi:MAG: TM2 domain-containing protein [Candidatus Poseidoniaceae archaeon]|nr:TM2 domain-containing protein [Candidatus Poseidoniaceae archaeon]